MIMGIGINADSTRVNGQLSVLQEDLEKFQAAGFGWAEIAAHSLDVIIHGELRKERLQEVKKLLQCFDLRYTLHGPDPVNLMDPHYGGLQEKVLRCCLELGAEIGASVLVYHCGGVPKEMLLKAFAQDRRELAELSLDLQRQEQEALRRLGDRARELGLTFCVENSLYIPYAFQDQVRFSGARIDHLVSHVKEIDHANVQICFDVAHGHISANALGFDLAEGLRLAKPYIRHLHLHDNFGLPNVPTASKTIDNLPLGFGDLHMPPGWGNIPYDKLAADLKDCQAVALVELDPRYQTPEILRQVAGLSLTQ